MRVNSTCWSRAAAMRPVWLSIQSQRIQGSLTARRIASTLELSPMLSLEGVSKQYPNGQMAVHELSLEVGDGETCMLVGPSGCGKTTTLRMINRLIEPSSGRILLDGDDVTRIDPVRLRLKMGYVIQQVGLFPHMTVADNVATVPNLLGWDRKRTKARVGELLELVGLEEKRFGRRYPHQLSGGQRQRVGV